jgi:HEAT repeat protein
MRERAHPAGVAVVLAAAICLLGAPAAAQDSGNPAPPKKPRRDGGPVFSPGDDKPADAPEKKPEKPPEPQKSELEILGGRLSGWPSAEARVAAEKLVERWAEGKPIVLALLAKPAGEGRAVAAGAFAFQRAADPEGIPALLGTLRDPRVYRWAGEVLDAVAAIDPPGAKDRLLPFLQAPSHLVVDRAAKVLQPLLLPADLPRLLEAARGKSAASRRAALGLASELDFAGAREALSAGLGDPSPEVALSCAVTLGARADEAGFAELNRLAREGETRRGTYAVMALVMAAEGRAAPTIEDGTTVALLGSRGLRSGDPLAKTAAAIALADLGYQRPDPVIDPLLETEIVPALLEVVAGTRFFADVIQVKPYVLARLHRLCAGTDALLNAPDWVGWWDSKRGSFTARRALTALPPAVRGTLRVRVDGEAAGPAAGATFAVSAADAPPAGGAGGRFLLLAKEQADVVAAAIEASGLLTMPENLLVGEVTPSVEIAVESAGRGRTVRLQPGAPAPASLEPLLRTLAEIRESGLWQSFWDRRTAGTYGSFIESERPFWSDPATKPEAKAVRLVRLVAGSLPDLPDGDRLAALEMLRREPALPGALRPEDASVLASLAAVGERLTPQGEAALRVLAAAGRTEGLSPLRARVDAASDDGERAAAAAILEESFGGAPLAAVLEAAEGTASLPVRCAAIQALGARPGEGEARVLAAVQRASSSEKPELRAAGYRALGRLRSPDAAAALEFAADKETDTGARCGALEGLGYLGGQGVVAPLGRAASNPDPRIRAAAVRGLATCREPEALTYVLKILTTDAEPSVREEADRAVKGTGGDRAREALRTLALDRRQTSETRVRAVEGLGVLGVAPGREDLRSLLADADVEVADTAAFVLAWVRDGDAAPRLLEALRAGRSPARTLRSLELLSLETFRQGRDKDEIAALYAGWFEVSRERGPRGWLAEALTTRGMADESIREFESGANPRAAVPALIKAFKDKAWFVRRAANLELQRIAGASYGEIDPWSPEDRAAALAEAWGGWWARERGSSK